MGSGGLCPGSSALLRPNLDSPGTEFSTCLDEMSMEISVRLDTVSVCRDPANSIRLSDDLGERWLLPSACLKRPSAFRAPGSWNFCAELDGEPLRSGFGVRRGGTEGFGDWSTSSTSKDLFNAEREKGITGRE
ncbi:hypothetical protein FKM82_023576 [Ascaphus truei]